MELLDHKPKKEQNSTDFKPTAEQIVFAEAYIESYGNITSACAKIDNPSRSKYYDWRKQIGFEEWLNEYARQEVLKRRGKWYLIAEKHAERGSFSHLEMLMQIAKEFTKEGSRVVVQTVVNNMDKKDILSEDDREFQERMLQHLKERFGI